MLQFGVEITAALADLLPYSSQTLLAAIRALPPARLPISTAFPFITSLRPAGGSHGASNGMALARQVWLANQPLAPKALHQAVDTSRCLR